MKLFKKWGNWVDLSVGKCNEQFYLLQARRRTDGKVQFRVSGSKEAYNAPSINLETLKSVTP